MQIIHKWKNIFKNDNSLPLYSKIANDISNPNSIKKLMAAKIIPFRLCFFDGF